MLRIVWMAMLVVLVDWTVLHAEEAINSAAGDESARSIVLSVKMLRVDRSRLRQVSGEIDDGRLVRLEAALKLPEPEVVLTSAEPTTKPLLLPISDEAALTQVLDDWRDRHSALNVLATPTLVTRDGQPASIHVGSTLKLPVLVGQSSVKCQQYRLGTACDCFATIGEHDRITLELRCRHQHVDQKQSITVSRYRLPHLIVDFDVDLKAELEPNQSYLLHRIGYHCVVDNRVHEMESVLIVKASLAPAGVTE